MKDLTTIKKTGFSIYKSIKSLENSMKPIKKRIAELEEKRYNDILEEDAKVTKYLIDNNL